MGLSCGSDSTPCPGTSICCGCSWKRIKKNLHLPVYDSGVVGRVLDPLQGAGCQGRDTCDFDDGQVADSPGSLSSRVDDLLSFKDPQTRRLKTIEMHHPTVLEARSPRSRCSQGCTSSQGSQRGSFLPLPASLALGCVPPTSASVFTEHSPSPTLCVWVQICCLL